MANKTGVPLVAHIALLCAAVALPLLALFAVLLYESASSERARLENSAIEQAADLAQLVERDLAGTVAMLQALATTPPLEYRDMAGFHERAKRLQQATGVNFVLRDVTGQQVVNTRVPWGTPLPRGNDVSDTDRLAAETKRPQVSNLFMGAVTKTPLYLVEVPVLYDGKVEYFLSASMPVEHMQQLLAGSGFPTGWWGTLIDRQGAIMARSIEPRIIGNRVLPPGLEALGKMTHKTIMTSPEGIRNFAAFHTIHTTGWSVGVAVPETILLQPLNRFLRWVGILAVVAVSAAAALATLYGRFIARDVGRLTGAVVALGQGERTDLLPSAVAEIDAARTALSHAAQAIETRASEREELLRSINAAKEEAEALSRAKSTFLSAVSHDLRQPFQAMRLFHHVLQAKATPDTASLVDNMGKALTSGEELLAALVELAQLDSGRVQVQTTFFALDGLLAEVVDECAPMAADANLTLRRVATTAWVRSDRVMLRRVLRNLVVNAIRYTREGGIVLGCRRRGGLVVVQVADTGIGIPRDKQKRIFEEFYQIGNSARDRSHGLGLGLAIVSRLSGMLGHPVAVSSVPERGSVFTVALERQSVDQHAEHRAPAEPRSDLDAVAEHGSRLGDDGQPQAEALGFA